MKRRQLQAYTHDLHHSNQRTHLHKIYIYILRHYWYNTSHYVWCRKAWLSCGCNQISTFLVDIGNKLRYWFGRSAITVPGFININGATHTGAMTVVFHQCSGANPWFFNGEGVNMGVFMPHPGCITSHPPYHAYGYENPKFLLTSPPPPPTPWIQHCKLRYICLFIY